MVWLYLLPFLVIAQTASPSAVSPSPTPSIIINPSSGLYLNEISPTSDTEWVELYNDHDIPVQLNKWKLQTESSTRNLPDNLLIPPHSYYIFNSSNFLSDPVGKTVKLVDQSGLPIDLSFIYPANMDNGLSWSKQSSTLWCLTLPSSQQSNFSCYTPPTDTPKPQPSAVAISPTTTPSPSLTPSLSPTSTVVPTPELSPTSFPYLTPEPSPAVTSGSVLSSTDSVNDSPAESLFSLSSVMPLIFIVSGGILLLIPLIVREINKNKIA